MTSVWHTVLCWIAVVDIFTVAVLGQFGTLIPPVTNPNSPCLGKLTPPSPITKCSSPSDCSIGTYCQQCNSISATYCTASESICCKGSDNVDRVTSGGVATDRDSDIVTDKDSDRVTAEMVVTDRNRVTQSDGNPTPSSTDGSGPTPSSAPRTTGRTGVAFFLTILLASIVTHCISA